MGQKKTKFGKEANFLNPQLHGTSVLASLHGKQNQKPGAKGKEMVNLVIPPHSSSSASGKSSCPHGDIFLISTQPAHLPTPCSLQKKKRVKLWTTYFPVALSNLCRRLWLKKAQCCFVEMAVYCPMKEKNRNELPSVWVE